MNKTDFVRQNPTLSTEEAGAARLMAAIIHHGAEGISRTDITIRTGLERSTRDRYLSDCHGEDGVPWVRYDDQKLVFATEAGHRAFPNVPPLPTGSALCAFWVAKLQSLGRIVAYLAEVGDWVERESIDAPLNLSRSTRDRYLSDIVPLGVVESQGTRIRVSPLLLDPPARSRGVRRERAA